jgi:hypothetical protein
MEATYRAFGGRLLVKINAETVAQLFREIGSVASVLDVDTACGKCKSPNIFPNVRNAQDYEYFELNCADCGARLSFGQHKEGGGLFPKRDKGDADDRGWYIYRAIEGSTAPSSAPASAPPPPAAPAGATVLDPLPLKVLLDRAKKETAQTVIVEMCDLLRGKCGDRRVDSEWTTATKPGYTDESIIRHLFGVLDREGLL